MLQAEDGQLRFRTLHVIVNSIGPGDPVPWGATDYAPVSLTAEDDDWDTYVHGEIAALIPGCETHI